ncbi:MAG: DASH family cryptochrome [Kangiellaceae bacterium]|jgi:deoxyribodipyrimidine photo-lyase|nr:DASH family cryptochrome [Kangiellaceae bacterium]
MSTVLYWFRNDLRTIDNNLLKRAIEGHETVVGCYVIESRWLESSEQGIVGIGQSRWLFLRHSLLQLEKQLAAKSIVLRLMVGEPAKVIGELTDELSIDTLYVSNHVGSYEIEQINKVKSNHARLAVQSDWNTTLITGTDAIEKGWLSGSFSKFRNKVEKSPIIDDFMDGVIEVEQTYAANQLDNTGSNNESIFNHVDAIVKDFNRTDSRTDFVGGEIAGLEHLKNYLATDAPSSYKQTRNNLDGKYSSTGLSPWLALGCLSPRRVWFEVKQYEAKYGANDSTYWIGFELLWREFFQWLALQSGSQLFHFSGLFNGQPKTTFNKKYFDSWCEGATDYPIVNALMRQLNSTGFMSNRGRQIVASCLVNELNQDWRYGAKYFERQLIDYDVASNWGNWQYIAGVGADPRGGRWFNLQKQTEQYDPDRRFIKQWIS